MPGHISMLDFFIGLRLLLVKLLTDFFHFFVNVAVQDVIVVDNVAILLRLTMLGHQ